MKVYRESILNIQFWSKLLFSFGLYYFWWSAKKLTIEHGRVTYSSGVFSKVERSIPMNHVQDVAFYSSFPGRLLNYGDIRIESAGNHTTEIVFENIASPNTIKQTILDNQQYTTSNGFYR